jgi:peptide/nickel transport system permease protein
MSEALPTVEPTSPVAAVGPSEKQVARRQTLRLLTRQPEFIIGGSVLTFWVLCAIFGPSVVPHNPIATDSFHTHTAPFTDGYIFGTDRLGRDVFSRVIAGARDVLIVAPIAALLGVSLGTVIGLLMGYYRGLVDDILSRLVEAFLSLPVTLVGLLTLVVLGSSLRTLVLVVGLLFAPIVARTVRAAVLAERELDYVQAAKLRGETGLVIMSREILPNVTGPIIVELTVRLGYAIFTISTLSFLGVGIQPPSPDWGLQISEEYSMIINGYWWTVLFPSIAIASLVVAANLIADALQGVLQR